MDQVAPPPKKPWHALLAPLPEGVVPSRRPVAPAEAFAVPGLEHVMVSLSAGQAGFRVVSVLLDESGRPVGASDGVAYRREIPAAGGPNGERAFAWLHESVSGRLDADASLRGMRWVSTSLLGPDGTVPDARRAPFEVTEADALGLRGLVDEVLRRLPPR